MTPDSTTLEKVKDIVIIIGTIVAIAVYFINSYFQFRNRTLENIKRFLDAHDTLFTPDGYIMSNIREMENGTYKRDMNNQAMEIKFNRLLGNIERIALLTDNKAISKTIQVYMFGWFAQKIQPELTSEERNNIYWELAIHYLDDMKKEADDYVKHDSLKRTQYWKKRHFSH